MLVVELVAVALGAVVVGRALRERNRARAALDEAVMADRRYRAWSGERSRAMAARNTIADVAQASGEAARKVQRGSTVVAGALGSLGGRVADSVRRLAASSSPELTSRGSVVRGTVVSSTADKDDWFRLMLEAAEAEDRARAEGRAELPTAPMPVAADDQAWEDPEDAWDDPADPDVSAEETVVIRRDGPTGTHPRPVAPRPVAPRPVDQQWLDDVPRDDLPEGPATPR